MKKLALFLLLAIPAFAQVVNPGIIIVTSTPSGSCSAGLPLEYLFSTGHVYACQAGTWADLGGGSSGFPTGTTNGAASYNGTAGVISSDVLIDPTGFAFTTSNRAKVSWSNTTYAGSGTEENYIVDNPATTGTSTQTQIGISGYDGTADTVHEWFGRTSSPNTFGPAANAGYVETDDVGGLFLLSDNALTGDIYLLTGGYTAPYTSFLAEHLKVNGGVLFPRLAGVSGNPGGTVTMENDGGNAGLISETPGGHANITSLVTWNNCTVSSNACNFTVSTHSSLTISSIPATVNGLNLNSLTLRCSGWTATTGGGAGSVTPITATFNSDTTAGNYAVQYIQGAGTTASANTNITDIYLGFLAGDSTHAGFFSAEIPSFANTSLPKPVISKAIGLGTGGPAFSEQGSGWTGTAAITQIVVTMGSPEFFGSSTQCTLSADF